MSDGKDTRLAPVNGRTVVVRKLTDAQMMLLSQMGKVVMDPRVDSSARMKASGTLMDILMAMVVQEDDRDYIQAEIVNGRLELSGMTAFVEAFKDTAAPAKVTRGRPVRAK